ncbi:MAG: glycyl-radical enzyme activating protein, partial [Planctomycetota bacterium]|nr:glycyl-radical enzyme activating protein [Planctomycetota bacterium]
VGVVMEVVDRDQLFMDESGGGVTFSGGEPLLQGEFLGEMLAECRKREMHTAVDTAGYGESGVLRGILGNVDLFLFDLKIMDEAEHWKYVGVSNRGILGNLRMLAEGGARVVIRLPVVPGVTDGAGNLGAVGDCVSELRLREIHLLAYHQYAAAKYERMKMANRMLGVDEPSAERMEEVKRYFEGRGFVVRVGG